MKLFINIVFIVLLLILVVTILRAPREIFGNFFRFILSLPIRIIPFGSYLQRAYREDKLDQQHADNVRQVFSTENHPRTIKIASQDSTAYLIIFGNYTEQIISADLYDILRKKRPELAITWSYIHKNDYTIVRLDCLPDLAVIMSFVKHMSTLYGTTNSYGYITSNELSFYCQCSNQHPDELIGETHVKQPIFYSSFTAKEDRDSLLIQSSDEINNKLNTDFFKKIVSNDHV